MGLFFSILVAQVHLKHSTEMGTSHVHLRHAHTQPILLVSAVAVTLHGSTTLGTGGSPQFHGYGKFEYLYLAFQGGYKSFMWLADRISPGKITGMQLNLQAFKNEEKICGWCQ